MGGVFLIETLSAGKRKSDWTREGHRADQGESAAECQPPVQERTHHIFFSSFKWPHLVDYILFTSLGHCSPL